MSSRKLKFGRYDYTSCWSFTAYAICSLIIPLVLVAMGRELDFPLESGGMGAGGVLHLVRSLAMVFSLMFCGIIGAWWGKRRSLGWSMLLMGGGIALCGAAPAYWVLLPCLLFAGVGEGVCEGMSTPFVQDLHQDEPERYVNISHSFWSVGIALAVVLSGGLLTMGVSWRVILVLAGLGAIIGGVAFLWKENPLRPYPERGRQIGESTVWRDSVVICRTPRFWVYCLAMFLGAGSEFCLTFWAASYLELSFGAGPWLAGLGTACIAAGMFTGRTLVGYFARPHNLNKILLGFSLGTIPLTLLLAWLEPASFASPILQFGTLFLLLYLSGIGVAPYWPTMQVYGVNTLSHLDSTMLYIYFSAVGVPGCGIFTWVMGALGDHWGLQRTFLVIPASLVLYAVVIILEGWVWPVKHKKDQSA